MERRNLLKLSPLVLLAGLFAPTNRAAPVRATLGFQQDPPIDWHYMDMVSGVISASSQSVLVDFSSVAGNAKVVHGTLRLSDTTGSGSWKIETRPTGLVTFPPDTGWLDAFRSYPNESEVGVQIFARCGNDSRFELRVTRAGSTNIQWAFAPIFWWS